MEIKVSTIGTDIVATLEGVWFSTYPGRLSIFETPTFMRQFANAIIAECDLQEMPKTKRITVDATVREYPACDVHALASPPTLDAVAADTQAALPPRLCCGKPPLFCLCLPKKPLEPVTIFEPCGRCVGICECGPAELALDVELNKYTGATS